MSPAEYAGYGSLAVTGYAFAVGVAARVFRRHDWFHSGPYGAWRYACPRVRPDGCEHPQGDCACTEWWGWAAIWPLVLLVLSIRFVALVGVAFPVIGLARAGFNLGRPNHDSEES